MWLDALGAHEWYGRDEIRKYLDQDKFVCVVSPELHKRAFGDFWENVLLPFAYHPKFMLCTDVPHKAVEVFGPVQKILPCLFGSHVREKVA